MKLKNKLFSVAAAGMLVFSNVSTAVVSANELTTISQENQQAIYSSNPGTRAVQTYSNSSTQSTAITTTNNVVVTNVSGSNDTILVKNQPKGAIVKVYDKNTNGKKLLGKATVNSKGEAKISVKQVGSQAGVIYLSLTEKDKTESTLVAMDFAAEPKTATLQTANVTITNNARTNDIITVQTSTGTAVSKGDTVKVYDSTSATAKLLGKATVNSKGIAEVKVKQIGTTSGKIAVTLTTKGSTESDKFAVSFNDEVQTSTFTTAGIVVVNNTKSKDTIQIPNVEKNAIITVYSESGKKLGSITNKPKGTSTISTAKIAVTIPNNADAVYLTKAKENELESEKVKLDIEKPEQSTSISTANVTVVNKNILKDTITVGEGEKLEVGDIITVYSSENNKVLGKATAKKQRGASYATAEVSLSIPDKLTEVYITKTQKDKLESATRAVAVTSMATSTTIASDKTTFINNAKGSDYVFISGLTSNDTIKIYDAQTEGSLIGTAKVGKDESQVYIKLKKRLDDSANIYVTRAHEGNAESTRVEISKSN